MKTALTVFAAAALLAGGCQQDPVRSAGVPQFKVDPYWPKPLPSNWILGQVAGIAVDREDRIWIVHRPATLVDDEKGALANPPSTKCCTPAPPVLQFDAQGNLLHPGDLADLADRDASGNFSRTIIKTETAERYGIRIGDYFV